MKRTKFDDAYEKIGGEGTGCLLIIPLMILGFFLVLKLESSWDLPSLLTFALFCLSVIGPQILFAHMSKRSEFFAIKDKPEEKAMKNKPDDY